MLKFTPMKGDTQMQKDYKKLWPLFRAMFVLSACTFGGGFVIVSLMKKKFVEQLGWIDEDEMLDVTAITQSSPGPLPVNASVISVFYVQFRTNTYIAIALQVMRAGVAAVIIDVVINLAKNVCKTRRVLYIAMMCIAFVCTYLLGVSAMIIIFVCLGIGIIDLIVTLRKEKKKCRCS